MPDLVSFITARFGWPKTKLDRAETAVVEETRAIVRSKAFRRLAEAGRHGEVAEMSIRGFRIIVEPALPPSYFGMSLFAEHGFFLGPAAFASPDQLQKTVLWEVYRLMTAQAEATISPGEAERLRTMTADFTERAWPCFSRRKRFFRVG